MITNKTNRVQAIKSKFESLNHDSEPLIVKKSVQREHLGKQNHFSLQNDDEFEQSFAKDNFDQKSPEKDKMCSESDSSTEDWSATPNLSYLHNKSDVKRSINDFKSTLTRQTSDPGKKLHRSHAFRCDRSKIQPQRHGSCNGRSETSDFTLKMDKKLSNERLKKLGNLLEDQMRKENFVVPNKNCTIVRQNSIPNSAVPKHILDQYAIVLKPKKKDDAKQEALTDSGVSSETENLEDDKINRIKRLKSHFENDIELETKDTSNETKTSVSDLNDSTSSKDFLEYKPNLDSMNDLCASSETMRLERKNPHLVLTDTLKKALKQPLPPGPPPKKPPRSVPTPEKKDTKHMLHKLEQVLEQREAQKVKNIYDIAETNLSLKKPKEMHYLCTEILDITQRSLLPNQNRNESLSNCLNALNCAVGNSTSSLPYTRLSANLSNRNSRICCSCSDESLHIDPDNITEFLKEKKCAKCVVNDAKSFKCHLKCKCKPENSEFFVEKEHIYDVPFAEEKSYGTLNSMLNRHRSLESLKMDEEKIYDSPCATRPATPEPKTDFQKLRENFERPTIEKPVLKPKPILKPKSAEDICESGTQKRFKKYATERRFRRLDGSERRFSKEKNVQLDVDRQNLNRLMNEIYETVTAACSMDENKPGSFPTELSDGSNSEESVKLTRSLTEKRKNYVRRVSSRVAYLEPKNRTRFRHQTSVCSYKSDIVDNPYSTFRSWKSFRTSQTNVLEMQKDSVDSMERVDDKTGCGGVGESGGLFNACLLVGLNYMAGEAYVKSVFPAQVHVPPHIENLIFPETLSDCKTDWTPEAKRAQCYSLVLTDERGERSYGYCRRVLPEGATVCLPLCYCIIGKYRAPGFYYKVLQEIESHHGSSEVEINSILQQLFETDFPSPGEEITISHTNRHSNVYRSSLNLDMLKAKTMPDFRHQNLRNDIENIENELPEFYDLENNNGLKRVTVNFESPRTRTIKRPLEPRADENSMSILLDSLGASLLIKVFGSLLLERKVIIISDDLSLLSSCLEALQSALYPFVWQQPLISAIPAEIQAAVLEAPLPLLAGLLRAAPGDPDRTVEEGMLIDLTQPSKVIFFQGDESTILPTNSYKSLKTTIQMESIKQKDKQDLKTRNVMISEAFLRFFVDILGDFEKYLKIETEVVERRGLAFDKEAFIKNAQSKQAQYFLEWFTETAMFNHFIQNMSYIHKNKQQNTNTPLVDTPLPNFYEIFEERLRSRGNINSDKNLESKSNYKTAMNKKVRLLKTKLRELVN